VKLSTNNWTNIHLGEEGFKTLKPGELVEYLEVSTDKGYSANELIRLG